MLHLTYAQIFTALSGFLAWGLAEIVKAAGNYARARRLTVAHVPEIDQESARAAERKSDIYEGLNKAYIAQIDQNTRDYEALNIKFKVVVHQVERLELERTSTKHMVRTQRSEIELLEEIIGAFAGLLPKLDVNSRELVIAKRAALSALRADSADYQSRRAETVEFLTGELPALAAVGVTVFDQPEAQQKAT